MKAKIHVTLKPGILDPQGKAIEHALSTLGYRAVKNVRVGKHIELELDETAVSDAEAQVRAMCEKLLANTIVEEYAYELESDRIRSLPVQEPERLIVLDEEELDEEELDEEEEEEEEQESVQSEPVAAAKIPSSPVTEEAAPAAPQQVHEHTPWATASAKPSLDAKSQEDARTLAKRILADLALLNPNAVEEGVRSGNFRETLKEDLDEGFRLFRQQVHESVRMQRDYFGEAVDEFVSERQKSLGLT